VVGKNMRMVVGMIQVPSRLLTLQMQPRREEPGLSSNPLGARPAGPALHNSQQSLRAQFSSSIGTRKHAKEEPNAHNSSSGNKADFGPEALEELRAAGISKPAT